MKIVRRSLVIVDLLEHALGAFPQVRPSHHPAFFVSDLSIRLN